MKNSESRENHLYMNFTLLSSVYLSRVDKKRQVYRNMLIDSSWIASFKKVVIATLLKRLPCID